ncbi:hypothetical protein HDU98_012073 [Podochytrium sp. JEL0797]|nr:hypothetical protein HDU98_012073 [Podochytrium sp. JEL0797]
MSLQSHLPQNITYALNILTILSHDREVVLRFTDFPPLGLAVLRLLHTTAEEVDALVTKEVVGVRELVEFETGVASCGGGVGVDGAEGKEAMERLVSVVTVLRNLSVSTVPNQEWLGKNREFIGVVVKVLRISPFVDVQEEEGVEEGDLFDTFGLERDDPVLFEGVEEEGGEGKPMRRLLFREACTTVLELRRVVVALLANISVHVKLGTVSNAATVLDVISDALETHTHLHRGDPDSHTWSWSHPASLAFLGEDLHPSYLLESFWKLSLDLRNSDLFQECPARMLDVVADACLAMLPGDGWNVTGTPDEMVQWDMALSCLYHVVVMRDGAVGEDVGVFVAGGAGGKGRRKGSIVDTLMVLTSPTSAVAGVGKGLLRNAGRECSLRKHARLAPLLLSLFQRPTVQGGVMNAALNQQYDPLCAKAARVLVEALQRGGEDARCVLKRFEGVLVGVGIAGPEGCGEEVWRRVGECLFLMGGDDKE